MPLSELILSATDLPAGVDSGGVRFGTLPFDHEFVSTYLDVDDATYLVIQTGTRCYQLVLQYVAQATGNAPRSLEVVDVSQGFELTAGLGMHGFEWGGRQLHCLRQTAGNPVGTQCCAEQKEQMVLFGEDEQVLRDFCSELIQMSEQTREHSFTIFHWNVQNQFWARNHCVRARPLESVILPSATKEELLADIADFDSEDTKDYYLQHGLSPHIHSFIILLAASPIDSLTHSLMLQVSRTNARTCSTDFLVLARLR